MRLSRTLMATAILTTLVALHFTLRPLLDWRAGVDFLVIGMLIIAVRVRPGAAALVGFALGLLTDAMSPDAFGAAALAMTLVGFGASRLKAAFFADDLLLNAIFIFVGKAVFDLIYLLAEGRLGGLGLVAQLFLWTPLAALVTAIVGLAVMAVVRPALEQRRPR
ncbi:MAG: rod shape-determining protein MreD [Gemmatimonadaceae bacterium]